MELNIKDRASLSLTGVKKIRSAEPNCVIANVENCTVVITGSNLSVQNISISTGLLELAGTVNGIKYTNNQSKKFSFKNMFK